MRDAFLLRRLWRDKLGAFGLVGLTVIAAAAVLAPHLPIADPLAHNSFDTLAAPGDKFPLGSDNQGRDMLSRTLYGARVSLLIALSAIGSAMMLGTLLGVCAGYHRGWTETLIMRLCDSVMAFPALILGIAIMAILGSGVEKVILCLAIVMTPRFARIAYGATMAIRPKEFIEAANAVSAPFLRIMRFHILPNIFSEVLVVAILWIGTAMQIEASLSFIGIGVPPPNPTWGNMIKNGLDYLPIAPWIALVPSAAIFLTIICFNLIGDAIRDLVDPRQAG